ncbi:STAS domain-containing protein [Desulfuromonas sp. KJ2020]|uniref:STAS domain-containing protein n=1 Tax=Desulfuromonas sp. KJ2020 TaxID=2919173 RepID=UPI0020A80AB1|nr:STAS domain-containing protein [Desulfuromonas sp. KJ2020]MCP3175670.1 STAS domain-containing protein [Desulfuromonas sp. KJ2020]
MEQQTQRIIEESGGISLVRLKGALTIQEVAELKTLLQQALSQSDQVVVDCSQAQKMDFPWLQLLCSAHRTAARAGKSLTLASLPASLEGLKTEAGFDRHCSCPLSNAPDNCLWVEDGHEHE